MQIHRIKQSVESLLPIERVCAPFFKGKVIENFEDLDNGRPANYKPGKVCDPDMVINCPTWPLAARYPTSFVSHTMSLQTTLPKKLEALKNLSREDQYIGAVVAVAIVAAAVYTSKSSKKVD